MFTPLAEAPVAADGSFSTRVVDGGRSFAMAVDIDGSPVLFGFIDTADPSSVDISCASTAAWFVFWGLGAQTLEPEAGVAILDLIASDPVVATLASEIEAAFVADTNTLTNPESPIRSAFAAAISAIEGTPQPSATASPSGFRSVDVMPTTPQSAVLVAGNESDIAVDLSLIGFRSGAFYLYQTHSEIESGEFELLEPREVVSGLLDPRGHAQSVGSLADVVNGSAWASPPEERLPFVLEEDEFSARYELVVAGGHAADLAPIPTWYEANNNPDKATWLEYAELMPEWTIVRHLLLPAIFSVTLPTADRGLTGIAVEDATSFLESMSRWVDNVPERVASGAWTDLIRDILVTLQSVDAARAEFERQLAAWISDIYNRFEWYIGFWEALGEPGMYLEAFMTGLEQIDAVGVLSTNLDAHRLDRWDIRVVPDPLSVRAIPELIDPGLPRSILRTTVRGQGDESCLRYSITSGLGCLVPLDAEFACVGDGPLELLADESVYLFLEDADILEGRSTTVLVELLDADCEFGTWKVVDSETVTVDHTRMTPIPACADVDILDDWQLDAGGLSVRSTGGLDGTLFVDIQLPTSDPVDVSVFWPATDGMVARDDIVSFGGGVLSVFNEAVYHQWADGEPGPLLTIGSWARFGGVEGSLSLQLPVRSDLECFSSRCCPRWGPDPFEIFGDVLTGDLLVVKAPGVSYAVAAFERPPGGKP